MRNERKLAYTENDYHVFVCFHRCRALCQYDVEKPDKESSGEEEHHKDHYSRSVGINFEACHSRLKRASEQEIFIGAEGTQVSLTFMNFPIKIMAFLLR